jgi:hypothetical protein
MLVHRGAIRNALIALFETPVSDDNAIGRTVPTRVLGPDPLDFGKPVFDFKDKAHLQALSKPGVPPVVWETKLKPSTRTVLNPIENEGHDLAELLLDFLVILDIFQYPFFPSLEFYCFSFGMYSVDLQFAENMCLVDGKNSIVVPDYFTKMPNRLPNFFA